MHRDDLAKLLDGWLEPANFRDVAENGLQVEGKANIERVVCGVSANRALIDAAIERKADAIFVHHGIVWGGGMRRLDGWLGERVRRLMANDITLFAYHLPLDAHPELGNNAGLADALGLEKEREPFGEYKGQAIGVKGELAGGTLAFADIIARVKEQVGEPLVAFGEPGRPVDRVGVCTGGAPELLYDAIAERLDVYITGEVTEWVKAVAEESEVCFIAGGHHATERFGAERVAKALAAEGLETEFVDVENPA